MGTSTAFGGGKNSNPLIPSWLDTSVDAQSNDKISPPRNGESSAEQPD